MTLDLARAGSATSEGAVRSLNEDMLLAESPVFVVADGMGGHAAGEVAAGIAVQTLAQLVGRDGLVREDVEQAVHAVNDAILAAVAADPAKDGMGTTLTGVVLGSMGGVPHWIVLNVGDSRTYRFASGVLHQLTVDHSEVEELVAAGQITAREARVHPARNIVTRSLGTDPGPLPDVWMVPVEIGEQYLVCSDGLTNELEDDEIGAILRESGHPQDAADRLVDAAVRAGGRDNVSVIVLRTGDPDDDLGGSIGDTAPRSIRFGDGRA